MISPTSPPTPPDPDAASPAPSADHIRVLAIDLDGTLLTPDKRVDEETAEALRAVARSGRHIILASARPPRSVRPTYALLGLDTLTVNYNGALIWDEHARSPHFHLPMSAATVARIVAAARTACPTIQVTCEILDRWYTDRHDPAHTTETGRLFPPDVIAPLDRFAHLDVTKLMLLGDPHDISALEGLIAEVFQDDIAVVRTDDDLIQIMDKRASKARAVEQVAAHYGHTMAQVLAIGDAPNDYAMIHLAGIGVAMSNAHPLVRSVAAWIAPPNHAHGVLATLRHFGLA